MKADGAGHTVSAGSRHQQEQQEQQQQQQQQEQSNRLYVDDAEEVAESCMLLEVTRGFHGPEARSESLWASRGDD